MRSKIAILALSVTLILGIGHSIALAGNTFNFLGESTWTVVINEAYNNDIPLPTTITMNGAISKLGTNYYIFQGNVQMAGDGPFLLEGGGTIINGVLYLTLTTSQRHTDSGESSNRDTGVMHVEITDLANLTGTFYEIGHDFDRGSKTFSERFTAGTVACNNPFSLNPATAMAPVQSLLLN